MTRPHAAPLAPGRLSASSGPAARQPRASSFEELTVRRQNLRAACRDERVDSFAILSPANIRYLSGFTGSNGALLVTSDREILLTDSRYRTQAGEESDCDIQIAKGPLIDALVQCARRLGVTRLAFEGNRISFYDHTRLVAARGAIRLKSLNQTVERLRLVKSTSEIAAIRAAVALNSAALEQALRRFKPGTTELDLAAEIEYSMRRLGSDGVAFETIVASGPRSALPHARPTANEIAADQLLLIDMGALAFGYSSDMTRTFAVGALEGSRARRMYHAVWEAQLAALDAVKPGVQASAVDFAARQVLRRKGFDKLFIHSTGHGLGLEIHEAPRLGRREAARLEAGMVVTIEPGVYAEGFGGVRIEDTVVVTPKGCEVLTPTTKELRSL
jgi:Xaa-Pro aminopeptidase